MKTKTYNFREFVRREHEMKIKAPKYSLIPLAATPLMPTTVFAESSRSQVMEAFSPIIDLIQNLAYPVSLVCVLAGGIFVMIGSQDKGFTMITRSALGYCLVMMLPMFMDILVQAMAGVSQ